MRSILQEKIFDNTVQSYLLVLGAILLAVLFSRFISRYLAGLLYKLIVRADRRFNKEAFFDLVVNPLKVFLLVLVVVAALDKLNYPGHLEFSIYRLKLSTIIDGLGRGTIVVVFIWLCIRIIDFIAGILAEKTNLTRSQSDNQLIVFFKDFFKVLLVIVGVLLFIRFVFNRDIGDLLTGLSIVGAAIALATRESLENLIASFIIFFDKPFVTGDTVKVQTFTGTIERIGLRSTRIRTADKTYISVPNKQMVDSIVDNISLRTQRRGDLRLELKLSVTTAELRGFIEQVRKLLEHPKIQKSSVHFTETGRNANVIAIEYFTGMEISDEEFNQLKEDINFGVMQLVEASGIDFATLNIDPLIFSRTAPAPQQRP